MPIYKAPVDDTIFLLTEVFPLARHANLPGFAEATPDLVSAVLAEAAKLAEEVVQPLNRRGDEEGCVRRHDGTVATPQGFVEAYRRYAEGGWIGLAAPTEYGGQGLPGVLAAAVNEFMNSANMAFAMYPGLTQGAIAALLQHGTRAQKVLYLPPLIAGRWSGTMNLTEPHCGSDLGLVRSKAVMQQDGGYRITGGKIFISAGEHDLTENIVHLVLARVEGAPAGIRGLSLFIIPKVEPNPDGSLGARNAVSCAAIETKMGIHGNATCVMNCDGAIGSLLGEENRGIHAMFTMMNEARLGVGVQGLALSEVAYQNAAAYAKERLQGRALGGPKFPERPADPIVVHPDVRRMLLTIRAFNGAARPAVVWTALQGDLTHRAADAAERQAAEDHMALLTPVLKGVLTDRGFANTVLAQQVFGGHGYIAEHGMEQFVRDARIAMLYEGTTGIQALDLVGRKLPRNNGRAIQALLAEIASFIAEQGGATIEPYVGALARALGHLREATLWLMQNAPRRADHAGAAASDYLYLMGLVVLGYMWCRIIAAVLAQSSNEQDPRRRAKLATGRFFVERLLPATALHLGRIRCGADSTMELSDEAF